MNIGIILAVIFVPVCVMAIFSASQKSSVETSKTASNEHFIVSIPKIVLMIGITCDLISVIVLLGFTLFSKKLPHIIFYIVFGLFLWLGTYISLKTLKFRVIVKGEEITVCYIFSKSYTFTFSEIVTAMRQIKKNRVKSERVVIKTESGKKLIVESMEISYRKFLQKLRSKVRSEFLIGFE